jgi:hypothetical protein
MEADFTISMDHGRRFNNFNGPRKQIQQFQWTMEADSTISMTTEADSIISMDHGSSFNNFNGPQKQI